MGRVHRGTLQDGMNVTIVHRDGSQEKTKIKELHTFEGMGRKRTDEVHCGDICAIVGLENFEIGDTICDFNEPEALEPIAIDEPTMSMLFTINDSPFFGKEGKFCTSRHINDRLRMSWRKTLLCASIRSTPTNGSLVDAVCSIFLSSLRPCAARATNCRWVSHR